MSKSEKGFKPTKKGKFHGSKDDRNQNRQRYDDKRNYDDPKTPASTHNDWRWYVDSPQLLQDVARLPFGNALGLKVGLLESTNPAFYQTPTQYVPGVCEIRVAPSLGCPDSGTDGATLGSRRLFNTTRKNNSGAINYESADQFMMVTAHAQVSAWLNNLRRVYGLASQYFTKNRYWASTVIRACGFDPDVVYNNYPQLRAHINLTAARLNQIKAPKVFPVRERWNWMNSTVFMDDDATKAQTYVYRFNYYLKWEGYKSETGTQLIPVAPRVDETTGNILPITSFDQITEFTELLLGTLIEEEDVAIMSADILKAFGDGGVTVESFISDDYVTLPKFDPDVLAQIHNTVCYAGIDIDVGPATTHHVITQSDGEIREKFSFNATNDVNNLFLCSKRLLCDVYHKDATPELVMVATRNMPTIVNVESKKADTNDNVAIDVCGSEIPLGLRIWETPNSFLNCSNIVSVDSVANTRRLVVQSAFNWHPLTYIFTSGKYLGNLGDLENYTVLNFNTLDQLHRNAMFAIFRTQ